MKAAIINAYQQSPFDDLFHLSPMRTGITALIRTVSNIINTKRGRAMVPLALPTLAALTPDSWELEVYDEQVEPVHNGIEADVIGISSTTHSALRAYELADGYRRKGMKVVLGGSHASLLPEEVSRHADAVCVGEAEECWPVILADVKKEKLQKRYRSSAYPDLTGAPIPDFSVIKKENYFPVHPLQASRGCPFTCAFCTVHKIFGHRPRFRSLQSVAEELDRVPEKYVAFVDDNISVNRRYLEGLLEILNRYDKTWFCQANLSIANHPKLLSAMYKSGCRAILVGLESVVPSNLVDFADKKNSMESMRLLLERIHDAGIAVLGMFIVGFDHDTQESVRSLPEFCRSSHITLPSFSILTPYPGTEVFDQCAREGRLLHTDWPRYNFYQSVVVPVNMSPRDLQNTVREIGLECFRLRDILRRALWHRDTFFLFLFVGFAFRRSYKSLVPHVH